MNGSQKTMSRKDSPRGTRMSKEDRRRHLIEAALEVFSNRGPDGTTTKEIASKAGVSEGIIYHHFPSKEDLYAAILDHTSEKSNTEEWLRELRDYADRGDDERFLRSLLSKILESYRTDRDYQRVMLYASLRGHELAAIANKKLGFPIFGFLRDHVRRRQSQGIFRQGDPGLLVLAIVSMPVYYSMVTELFGIPVLEQPDEELVATFAQIVMEGLREPKERL